MKRLQQKKINKLPDYSSLFDESKDNSKLIYRFIKKMLVINIKPVILSTIYYIIKACPIWIFPIITSNIINIATYPENNSVGMLFVNGAIMCVLIIQNPIMNILYRKQTSSFLRSVAAGLRNSLVKKLQQLSITYHNKMKTGALQSKFLRDIDGIEMLFGHLINSLIPAMISLVITIIMTLSKSLMVSLCFALMVPLNVFVINMHKKVMDKSNRAYRKQIENVSSKSSTMLEMIPVTKSHGLENEEINKMESSLMHMQYTGRVLDFIQSKFEGTTWALSQVLNLLCLIITGYMAYIGELSVGDVVLFQSYFTTLTGTLTTLLTIFPEFSKGAESIKSVSEVMLSTEVENNRNKITLRYVHGTVQFKNVSYHYPDDDKNVISNLTLTAEPGECIALVGSSGSGKSTVMNMIIGFLTPTDGELLIDGKPIEALNLSSYRQYISVVPQISIMFPGTIRDNITYGLHEYSEEKFQEVLKLANISEFVDKLPNGVNTIVEEHGGNLSGGQKQRISIARALMRDPQIIILDEATSALDTISEYHVQQAMNQLIKGRTTFIVAHRLSTIRNADKIVVLENGRNIESGTYDELMALKGKFFELKTLNDIK